MTMLLKLTIFRYLTFDFRFVEANECLADVKIKKKFKQGCWLLPDISSLQ